MRSWEDGKAKRGVKSINHRFNGNFVVSEDPPKKKQNEEINIKESENPPDLSSARTPIWLAGDLIVGEASSLMEQVQQEYKHFPSSRLVRLNTRFQLWWMHFPQENTAKNVVDMLVYNLNNFVKTNKIWNVPMVAVLQMGAWEIATMKTEKEIKTTLLKEIRRADHEVRELLKSFRKFCLVCISEIPSVLDKRLHPKAGWTAYIKKKNAVNKYLKHMSDKGPYLFIDQKKFPPMSITKKFKLEEAVFDEGDIQVWMENVYEALEPYLMNEQFDF